MTPNLTSFFRPSYPWPLFWLKGPDAADFLHRMTSAQVRDLAVGRGIPATLLTPQGKLISYFWIWRSEVNDFLLEVRSPATREPLIEALEKFHFAEDFSVELPPAGWTCTWTFGWAYGTGDLKESKIAWLNQNQTGPVLTLSPGSDPFGDGLTISWGPQNAIDLITADLRSETVAALLRRRIETLTPYDGAELSAEINPLEAGLPAAIADQKGCYPGQEVLEKIISLGSPAKRLVRLESSWPITVGTAVLDSKTQSEVGKITSSTEDAPYLALAIVRKTVAQVGLSLTVQTKTAVVQAIAPYKNLESSQ